ncbi:procathepsin L-like [Engraulis encrasicolus]|uniref:procathepsin L-like n=1 Tax=Engraulis encrasicolus TaxID=184585 RepID=UPI002FD49ECD
MKWLIVAAACLAVVSCASLSLEDLEFHAWKLKFGKSYSLHQEEAYRKDIWLSSRRRVLAHNLLATQGIHSYRMGMNQFSDMDPEEFREKVLLKDMKPSNETKAMPHLASMDSIAEGGAAELADTVDWRDKGCVTEVKSQGQCGSCWTFSVTGALEAHTCIKHGYLASLSEQQLVDCTRPYGESGCGGGWMDPAFQYIRDNGGIDTEEYYPYIGQEDYCRFNPAGVGATCKGFHDVTPKGDESALQNSVARQGPVSVAVDASRFADYQSGVFNDPYCNAAAPNHAVLVVGYGSEGGQDYWLVKNSWGVSWGEQGYIKMARNQYNQCGIASYASYPAV